MLIAWALIDLQIIVQKNWAYSTISLVFSLSELNQALFPDIAGQKRRVLVPLKTILAFKVVLGHAKNLIGP